MQNCEVNSNTVNSSVNYFASEPPWFTAFLAEFRSAQQRNEMVLKNLTARVADIEEKFKKQSAESIEQFAVLKSDISSITTTLLSKDSCELRVTGIPCNLSSEPTDIVKNLFTALELPSFLPHIMKIRDWHPPTDSSSTDATSRSGLSLQRTSEAFVSTKTRTMILKMSSSAVRDDLLARSSKLRGLDAEAVFGSGGKSKVFISPLWPKPVYLLWRQALGISKNLNYARPVVRNLIVCMRETLTSNLVPVFYENDFHKFKQRVVHRPP